MEIVQGGAVSALLKEVPIPRMFRARQAFSPERIAPEEIAAAVEAELGKAAIRALARTDGAG